MGQSPAISPATSAATSPVEMSLLDARSMPYFQHPSRELLEEHGFVQHKYSKFRAKCVKDRKARGSGQRPEMNPLFRFWSHFLRQRFNKQIYNEFKALALDDAQAHHRCARSLAGCSPLCSWL